MTCKGKRCTGYGGVSDGFLIDRTKRPLDLSSTCRRVALSRRVAAARANAFALGEWLQVRKVSGAQGYATYSSCQCCQLTVTLQKPPTAICLALSQRLALPARSVLAQQTPPQIHTMAEGNPLQPPPGATGAGASGAPFDMSALSGVLNVSGLLNEHEWLRCLLAPQCAYVCWFW